MINGDISQTIAITSGLICCITECVVMLSCSFSFSCSAGFLHLQAGVRFKRDEEKGESADGERNTTQTSREVVCL